METSDELSEALEKDSLEVVIANYSMPQFSAPAALKMLKDSDIDVPFIIVSPTISEELAVSAMKAGAHDYVMKGNLARLNPAVERELREVKVLAERRAAAEEERRLHDEREEQQGQLEQRIRELTALNSIFQRAYRELLTGLRGLPEELQKLGSETSELVKRAEAQPISALEEVSLPEDEGGDSAAQQ